MRNRFGVMKLDATIRIPHHKLLLNQTNWTYQYGPWTEFNRFVQG